MPKASFTFFMFLLMFSMTLATPKARAVVDPIITEWQDPMTLYLSENLKVNEYPQGTIVCTDNKEECLDNNNLDEANDTVILGSISVPADTINTEEPITLTEIASDQQTGGQADLSHTIIAPITMDKNDSNFLETQSAIADWGGLQQEIAIIAVNQSQPKPETMESKPEPSAAAEPARPKEQNTTPSTSKTSSAESLVSADIVWTQNLQAAVSLLKADNKSFPTVEPFNGSSINATQIYWGLMGLAAYFLTLLFAKKSLTDIIHSKQLKKVSVRTKKTARRL